MTFALTITVAVAAPRQFRTTRPTPGIKKSFNVRLPEKLVSKAPAKTTNIPVVSISENRSLRNTIPIMVVNKGKRFSRKPVTAG